MHRITGTGSPVMRDLLSRSDAAMPVMPATTAATVTEDVDHVMRRVDANDTHPILYEVLWGEIAKFTSRHDVLNLRSANRDISKWVDTSITRLTATADQAPAMLAAMGNARNLNHISTLRFENCANDNLSEVIQAFAARPHATFHVEFARNHFWSNPAYELELSKLGDIAPASLLLSNFPLTRAPALQKLAQLNYPIHLHTGYPRGILHDQSLQALADIPQLASLAIMVSGLEDGTAQTLGTHPNLTELHLYSCGTQRLAMSDSALIALAGSETLRTLHIAHVNTDFSEIAIAALAGNRGLEALFLGGTDDFFQASVALALSDNATLKRLHISLLAGCGHLVEMPSLEHLTLRGVITLDDARQFAKHAHLKTLYIHRSAIYAGALAVIASCDVAHLKLDDDMTENLLTDKDVDALLENKALRSLKLFVRFDQRQSVPHAIRLAGHATLETLTISYKRPAGVEEDETIPIFTGGEWIALTDAWGGNRSPSALDVDYR